MAEPSVPSELRSHAQGPCERSGRQRRGRRFVALLLIPALLMAVVRIAALQGLVRPVRIVGGSMAETLCGPHYSWWCVDCGIEFRCGTEFAPADGLAVCPNCGYPRNQFDEASRVPGQRVLIDRWRSSVHTPPLWQSMAYASAAEADFLAVKRLVAGGGGRVAIRDGDVLVDGQIQRKTLAQLRELCILVHDDHFRPRRDATLPARWLAASGNPSWRCTPAGYEFTGGSAPATADIEWLEYTQWICWPHAAPPAPRTTPAPIFDHDGYNQSLTRGALNQVTDVLLQCDVHLSGTGRLLLRISAGGDSFQLELDYPRQDSRLTHNGETVWQSHDDRRRQQSWNVEMAVCDQQVLAAINGRPLLTFVFQPTTASPARPTCLAIGAVGVNVQLESPRISRDVHYLGPGGQQRWELADPLEPHEWFLLGDNVPISIDSRRTGPIARDTVLGPVYKLPW